MRGFADDLAVVLRRVWVAVPALGRLVTHVAPATVLRLNPSKCMAVPLSPRPLGRLQPLEEAVPAWCAFRVAVKYLEVVMGVATSEWGEALAKFRERVAQNAGLELGHALDLQASRVLAVSTLGYLMQIKPLPRPLATDPGGVT